MFYSRPYNLLDRIIQKKPPDVLLKTLQNSQKSTCVEVSFLNKVAGPSPFSNLLFLSFNAKFLIRLRYLPRTSITMQLLSPKSIANSLDYACKYKINK